MDKTKDFLTKKLEISIDALVAIRLLIVQGYFLNYVVKQHERVFFFFFVKAFDI